MDLLGRVFIPRHANGLNRDYDVSGTDDFFFVHHPRHANGLNRDYDRRTSSSLSPLGIPATRMA